MSRLYGMDIGSTFITIWSRGDGEIVLRKRHSGKIPTILASFISTTGHDDRVTITGKSADDYFSRFSDVYVEESEALSAAVRQSGVLRDGYAKIVDIGASSLTLYTIRNGRIADIQRNSLCAAGTGLFLEEQAERLEIDLENMGELSVGAPPLIASRCTVFAKSDLIHHQQEGRTKDEMWAGLCRSLAFSAMNTLFRSEEVYGKIVLIGGVSSNLEVVKWLRESYVDAEWIVPANAAAFLASGASYIPGVRTGQLAIPEGRIESRKETMPPLTLRKTRYPHFTTPTFDDMGNEIRIHGDLNSTNRIAVGMDIGSTSTKIIAIDYDDDAPLFDIYRKTHGEPVDAARHIFVALYRIAKRHGISVSAFGTTGSGRRLAGEVFGADRIVNEITAHGTGTGRFYPDVETIFEIGGQDAKYIRLKNGNVHDVNMNYVCAAGTGSFIEEQVRKLGFSLFDAGDITEGVSPPVTSDRCTVFMEQDMRKLLETGYSREEVLASVHYSIIKNYLNRVVGNRYVNSEKVFFQGATARNRGLVAAFENLLDVEVVVSPFCHVMGSLGAALIARDAVNTGTGKTGFIGDAASDLSVTSRKEVCRLCNNYCRINYVTTDDGREVSWGYQCGRDPSVKKRRNLEEFRAFIARRTAVYSKDVLSGPGKGVVGIANSLANHTFYPLWSRFFAELGYETKLSSLSTTQEIKNHASKIASGDFCFPVKASMGHVVSLLKREIPVFHPSYIAEKPSLEKAINYFCPYVEGNAGVIRSAIQKSRFKLRDFMAPVIDFRHREKEIIGELYGRLKPVLDVRRRDVKRAWRAARDHHRQTVKKLRRTGEKHLAKLRNQGKPFFVILGRPYNTHDRGINLGIPETIASMGYDILPIDMLDLTVSELSESNHFNMFWHYGQKIIAAARRVREIPNAFPIYLTNFNCGPDSFLLSYAEEELKGKPMLILELDEHDSDGGYRTRIEAFVDVVNNVAGTPSDPVDVLPDKYGADYTPDLNATVWIPPMHETGTPFFAAAFRGFGYDSRPLPVETESVFQAGKRHLRGGECLPMTLTLGAMLETMRDDRGTPQVLFMPTSEGPCRFGQYNMLERIVFHNRDITDIDILAPSSINSYQGLGEDLRRYLMHAMMAADILLKLRTKIRPYEKHDGDTLALYEKSIRRLENLLEKRGNTKRELGHIAAEFNRIPRYREKKPLVGIVGEIYVRCNAFANQDLIGTIEQAGGEAWLAPMHEWILYTAKMQNHLDKKHGASILEKSASVIKNMYLFRTEHSYYRAVSSVLADREEPPIDRVMKEGERYLPLDFTGEALITVGRTILFAEQGASMVVNAAPFGCMPGTLTSSIFQEVKDRYDMPIISQFYDGEIDINDKVTSLLRTICTDR